VAVASGTGAGDGGVVEEDVKAAEAVEREGERSLPGRGEGDVAMEEGNVGAVEVAAVLEVDDNDFGALGDVAQSDAPAEAALSAYQSSDGV
jgi:hypothetical protein